jgi:hypothetical protein
MDGLFWTSYGILAGLALGFTGLATGILVARRRVELHVVARTIGHRR